MKSVFLYNKTN